MHTVTGFRRVGPAALVLVLVLLAPGCGSQPKPVAKAPAKNASMLASARDEVLEELLSDRLSGTALVNADPTKVTCSAQPVAKRPRGKGLDSVCRVAFADKSVHLACRVNPTHTVACATGTEFPAPQ